MRTLTLDEKITIKGLLARWGIKGIPRLNTANAIWWWSWCTGTSIKHYGKYLGLRRT